MVHQVQSFKIKKMLIHETGTYNQQYRRPYNTNLSGQTLSVLQERLAGAPAYAPSMMGGVANQFISPTATPEKAIDVPGGWNERRMRFMMEVEIGMYAGAMITEVILGWTSHMGITVAGAIDPQMEFYVNSTLQIRNSMQRTPVGMQNYSSVVDNSHILIDPSWKGVYSPEVDKRLRPEDVFSTMSRTHLTGLGNVLDGRTSSMNTAVKSRRTNGSAASYMASILRDYSNALKDEQFGQGEQELLAKARGFSQENLAANDMFLAAISNIRGMGVQNVFQYKDLMQLDPGVEHVTLASMMGDTQRSQVHQTGQTADWGHTDRETSVATVLSQSVPALMMDLAITNVVFRSTNQDFGTQMTTVVMDAKGFSAADLSPLIDQFKIQLEHVVLRDLTYDNQISYALEMQVDLLGETWIRLSLDGGAFIDYVTPSFCDALTVPVLTTNDQLAVTLAGDFEMLANELNDASKEKHPSIMSAGGAAFGNI